MSKPNKIQIRNSTAEYLQNIFATGEIDEKAVCRDFRHTAECWRPIMRPNRTTAKGRISEPSVYNDPAAIPQHCHDA